MATIAGIFENPLKANRAVPDLLEIGVRRDDITLMMSDKMRDAFQSAASDTGDRVAEDTATGSIAGGVLGALVAGLTSVGSILIPGLNLLVIGPLIAIIAGLGTGAVAGGLVGALVAAGLNEVDARRYGDAVKSGKAVLLVHNVKDENVTSIRSILSDLAEETKAA